mmetsp:Transcript_21512/g.50093  ORF Transcript_21512/g.50093 Transcript_21512/m.50093 type:complete len:127 (-) Transcript_21512:79-459(-)|eukprot:CAMPEP_0171062756 /NCGR_PEP_ID=MMETSP0766_2-20121228/5225_1 /TAXON_ID=439317 /ORGANISM="Gambierdiscus australes, Strain CAWD 149" /LENGTH=126 /DNA_ID=CAMNT_0011518565 /DNA_START=19 /DNA_END=399 /DNA_ORIENTATION=-
MFLQYVDLAVRAPGEKDGDNFYNTALRVAAEKGEADVVKMYLDVGTDPNTRDAFGRTPLHIAASMGRVEVAQVCLAQKLTDRNAKDIYGRTPLQIAESNNDDCSSVLIENKAEIAKLLRSRGRHVP